MLCEVGVSFSNGWKVQADAEKPKAEILYHLELRLTSSSPPAIVWVWEGPSERITVIVFDISDR